MFSFPFDKDVAIGCKLPAIFATSWSCYEVFTKTRHFCHAAKMFSGDCESRASLRNMRESLLDWCRGHIIVVTLFKHREIMEK